MIKVAIDTSALLGPSKFRGIGKYTAKLIEFLKLSNQVKVVEIIGGRVPKDVDIVHYPYFDFFFPSLPLIKKKKTIVTIHDCTPLVFPDHYPPGIRGKMKFIFQKFSLGDVSAVITDSFSSQKDIEKFLKIPSKKIEVVYLAPAEIFEPIKSTPILRCIGVKYSLPEKFVLYVGDVNYNKNLSGLIEAFSCLKNEDLHLFFVGKSFEDTTLFEVRKIKSKIQELNLKDKISFLGFVEDHDLPAIYSLASVYCQPSLYEGFGLQILEAMACGCPVVTSNVSSMPEVAGKAAVLVDPDHVNDIAAGIRKLVEEKEFRNEIIEAGFQRVKNFTWKKTAEETIRVYEGVLRK